MNTERVVTEHINPPIPIRTHDWSAVRDGYEPGDRIGWGDTEEAAKVNLFEQEADEDEAICPKCGERDEIDRHGSCRSPACESSRADAAEYLADPDR